MPWKPYPWPLGEMEEWYHSGYTLQEISDQLASDEYQQYWKDNLGREYRPKQRMVNKVMKRSGVKLRKTGAMRERNGNWSGGRLVDKGGYILVKCDDHPYKNSGGYVREHRLLMEKKLGRYLEPHEVVHHKNDDTGDNRIENLELFPSQSEHISKTTKGKRRPGQMAGMKLAAAAAAKKKHEWWPYHLLKSWHHGARLSVLKMAELLTRGRDSVRKAMQRALIWEFRKRILAGEITDAHRAEAAEWLATHPKA